MKKIIALIIVFLAFITSAKFAFTQDNLTGEAFREVSAAAWLNSEPLKIADQKGKIVIIEFWATWCPPCRRSIPRLIELYKKYKDKGVVLMAFTDEAKETAEPFAKKMNMTYPIGTGSSLGNEYGVEGIPHAIIVGTDGKIAWSGNPLNEKFEKAVEELAAKLPAGSVTAKTEVSEAPKTSETNIAQPASVTAEVSGASKTAEINVAQPAPATAEVEVKSADPAGK